MSQISTTLPPEVAPAIGLRRWWGLYMELAKARLSFLVVITAAVGYAVGARGRFEWATFFWTVLGTALAAACANAMNQVVEVERDAKMNRTARRPLPSGRMSSMHAAAIAVLAGGVGVTILAAMVNFLTALLGMLTIALYLLVYTPMKVRTTLNTLAGAVVGAIPPMMGWTAAHGQIDAGAWSLGAILFVWQIPHFLALAWMYREDYERGGYKMLPGIDPSGQITCRTVLMWSAAMLPVGLTATWLGLSGYIYAACSIGLGLWLLHLAGRLYRNRTQAEARKVFLATVMYLPLLLIVMVLDRPADIAAARLERTPQPVLTQLPANPGT